MLVGNIVNIRKPFIDILTEEDLEEVSYSSELIEEDDCFCKFPDGKVLIVLKTDDQTIEKILQRMLINMDHDEIINSIKSYCQRNVLLISDFLSAFAWKLFRRKINARSFLELVSIESKNFKGQENISKFFREWIDKRVFRQFYLWGLTKAEAIKCIESLTGSKSQNISALWTLMSSYPERFAFLPPGKVSMLETLFQLEETKEKHMGKVFCLEVWNNLDKGNSYTSISKSNFEKYIKNHLENLGLKIVSEEDEEYNISPISVNHAESYVYNHLIKKIRRCPDQDSWDSYELEFFDASLSEEQQGAVKMAIKCPISIITGGPGTGKTRIIKEIICQLNAQNITYQVTSFTGKAISRVKELSKPINVEAETIDRLIIGEKKEFKYLIIDESSMVTTHHLYRLFMEFHPICYNIVFVGDLDQIPPIGWGHIFDSLIWSQRVPIARLLHNYRVDEVLGKEIIINSRIIVDHNRKLSDSQYLQLELSGPSFDIFKGNLATLKKLIGILRDKKINIDDVTFLCPYNEPIDKLNTIFQDTFIKPLGEQCINVNGNTWYVGDRVMMTANCYDVGVMNGEIGKVLEIGHDGIVVSYPDYSQQNVFKYVCYYLKAPKQQYNDAMESVKEDNLEIGKHLKLSYAISIHKSQGSEYPISIIFLPEHKANSGFLNINLLYTAITRAKKCAWVIHESEASLIYCLSKRSPKVKSIVEEKIKETCSKIYSDIKDARYDYEEEYDWDFQ